MRASPWEPWAVERMRDRVRATARRWSRSMTTIGMTVEDTEQVLYLAVVRATRKWAGIHGEADPPDLPWLGNAIRYEVGHLRRSAARHGVVSMPLRHEIGYTDDVAAVEIVAPPEARPDERVEETSRQRAMAEVCALIEDDNPDRYVLLTAAVQGEIPSPMTSGERSAVYRAKIRSRHYLATLGIRSMEDLDDPDIEDPAASCG